MTGSEFNRVWLLLGTLFPAATAKKNKNDLAVWKRGLEGYSMAEVSDRIMDYAKSNKFFPDLADITNGLTPETSNEKDLDAAIMHNARIFARVIGVKAPAFANGAEAMSWYRTIRRMNAALKGAGEC